ncbi:ATP synthase, F0 complex, b subunit [Campylobacter iguaniorum]|uniref:ATP synthase subunit b n=1 Tax=Campylobacter iguaniorum TaxID=1244531 RepID=A0A076FD34_9BACT|nr:F0F1 ATP synthase subunit B [Campylobacter iguaniorum]AII15302.1 ATP synthase, F0 complex, b subunit [Campylobacter iguaniorum]ALV25228.1 ATP synthase, F0 complex, b subunit [Campylobacter iguaniorum]ANE36421.1 ATP synthase, F0 complex, b subunit [Campylobacter iguaniorum]
MKKYLSLLLVPAFMFASTPAGEPDYDIVARTINFVIFAGILYYLIAEPVKNAYKGRINSISARLESIQDKLRASKAQREDALRKVEEAKSNANELIQTAKKEAEHLVAKINAEAQNELNLLEKSFEEQKSFEERKIVRSVVNEVLEEVFAGDTLKIDQNEFVNLVLKKVS